MILRPSAEIPEATLRFRSFENFIGSLKREGHIKRISQYSVVSDRMEHVNVVSVICTSFLSTLASFNLHVLFTDQLTS